MALVLISAPGVNAQQAPESDLPTAQEAPGSGLPNTPEAPESDLPSASELPVPDELDELPNVEELGLPEAFDRDDVAEARAQRDITNGTAEDRADPDEDSRQGDMPAGSEERAVQGDTAADSDQEGEAARDDTHDPLVTRLETKLELDRLVGEESFQEALPVATRLVELTREEFGNRSRQTAEAIAELASVQSSVGEYDAAERNYLQSIEIVRAIDGVYSPLAVAPLTGLGDNYQQAKQYLNAVSAYSEARTVSRRIFGLLNEDQLPLIDRMTVSLQSLNRHEEADQLQLEALQLAERKHEPGSPEVLAAIYKYARWLRDTGRYQEERNQYARAVRVIREHYGDNSTQLVTPLVAIGNSFRHQRIPEGQGVSALKDALSLVESQQDPDRLLLAQVLRDLGDWEVAFSKVGYDGGEYRRAWSILDGVDGGAAILRSWFSGPEYVLREPISQRSLSEEPDARSGHVLVKFDLDEFGRTDNVLVVESDPPGLKDEAVLRHVRRSRFRPQMVDGELVRGKELALQFTYRYSPDEIAAQQQGRN